MSFESDSAVLSNQIIAPTTTARAWNRVKAGFCFTLEHYPNHGRLALRGWCFDLKSKLRLRLRLRIGGKSATFRRIPRRDVSLLYPKRPDVGTCGFCAQATVRSFPLLIEMEARRRGEAWSHLAAFDLESRHVEQWEQTVRLLSLTKLLDPAFYFENKNNATSCVDVARHYLQQGAAEGRDPNPIFSSVDYWRRYPDALNCGANPLLHYLVFGREQNIQPNPYFDPSWNCHRYPEVMSSGLDPLAHHLHFGATGQFIPSLDFDPRFYLRRHPEIRKGKQHPLAHFLRQGRDAGERPTPPLKDCWTFCGPRFDPAQADPARARILIVGHWLGSILFGSESSLLDVIEAIDLSRFDLFVAFPGVNEEVFARLRTRVQGICVFNYFWWRAAHPFEETSVSAFAEICRTQKIDLVHTNTITLSEPLLAGERLGIPRLVHAREIIAFDDELARRFGATPNKISRFVCQNTTHLLANSIATQSAYPCFEKSSFVYNVVDANKFDLPNVVDPKRIHVGLLSSNIPKKGIHEFLDLARSALEPWPHLQFHLIGPETDIIRTWRATGSLPPNCQWHDYINRPADAYAMLNIVLNLSRFGESFGRTVAEAMMSRRPVIAYRHGALPELIAEAETGFLVSFRNVPAVLDRLGYFAQHAGEIVTFGEKGRERAKSLFSQAKLKVAINNLYEDLLSSRGTAGPNYLGNP